jgi:hypothetical protein
MNPLYPPQSYLPSDGGRQSPQRLVFLVPNSDFDEVKFSWAIRKLANQVNLDVTLVSIATGIEDELAARRSLATVCSFVNEFTYNIDYRVIRDHSWIHAVRNLAHPGDLIICPPEVTVRAGFRKSETLDAAIARRLKLSTQPLPNLFNNSRQGILHFLKPILYWIVIAAILMAFFILESGVGQTVNGFLGQTVIVILMAFEMGAIYLWSSITG